MVFCRVRGLPDEDEPKESREGLCSLTDMVRLCGQRYIAATRLCGPQEPASSRRTRVQAKGAGGVCLRSCSRSEGSNCRCAVDEAKARWQTVIASIDNVRCSSVADLASTIMAEMVCRIALSSTLGKGRACRGGGDVSKAALERTMTRGAVDILGVDGFRGTGRTRLAQGGRNGSLDRSHELMTGQILYDQATGLQRNWYIVGGCARTMR
jgi:hypothetical protein